MKSEERMEVYASIAAAACYGTALAMCGVAVYVVVSMLLAANGSTAVLHLTDPRF